jgi:hypothetical protein
VGGGLYPILDCLLSPFDILFPDEDQGLVHPFDQIEEIRGRKSDESIQRGLNLKGMGPRFSALSKERAIG